MAGNKTYLDEIKRYASEMAFNLGMLTVDESTAAKFEEQTIAKNNAEGWLKKFQADELDKLKVFE